LFTSSFNFFLPNLSILISVCAIHKKFVLFPEKSCATDVTSISQSRTSPSPLSSYLVSPIIYKLVILCKSEVILIFNCKTSYEFY
jgi:hypothetical protein